MNKNLFGYNNVNLVPAETVNKCGEKAYNLEAKAALAQFVCTGTFNNTFYCSDKEQFDKVIELCSGVDPEFIAKLAVYARQKAVMKDSPAVLAAFLSKNNTDLLGKIFNRVINDPKMFRNFIQVIRSGTVGRKSFGSKIKKMLIGYINNLTDEQLFKANIGNNPSLKDCLKMLHPKPSNKERNALYAYLLDKEYKKEDLCELVRKYEAFKKDMSQEIPDVPFQMLTALPLTDSHWKSIAKNATFNQVRMNLNSYLRHNVLKDSSIVSALAEKLQDPNQVRRSKVFPYQLFTTYQNIDAEVPMKINVALQNATEIACENIPEIKGKVYVMVDVSGSMSSPVTGSRGTVSTKTRCVDVAALFASAILRKNPDAEVIPFDTSVHMAKFNPKDSITTNAAHLATFGGGGTNCALPLEFLNKKNAIGQTILYISDNESNVNTNNYRCTSTMAAWNKFKARNPEALLINVDIQPTTTTQTKEMSSILNIGGFSDQIFDVIKMFIESNNKKDSWVDMIEKVTL